MCFFYFRSQHAKAHAGTESLEAEQSDIEVGYDFGRFIQLFPSVSQQHPEVSIQEHYAKQVDRAPGSPARPQTAQSRRAPAESPRGEGAEFRHFLVSKARPALPDAIVQPGINKFDGGCKVKLAI